MDQRSRKKLYSGRNSLDQFEKDVPVREREGSGQHQ